MRIKCRAYFPINSNNQFGFYGLPNEPQRRIKGGEEFYFEYNDKNKAHKICEVDGRNMIGSWVEVLEMPKKARASKVIDSTAEVIEEPKSDNVA